MDIGNLLNNSLEAHFILLGYIDKYNYSSTNKYIGHLKELNGIVKKFNINEIIIPEKNIKIRDLISLIKKVSNTNVAFKLVPEGEKLLIGKGQVDNLSGVSLFDVELPLFDKYHIITKRIFDLFFSIIIIILTLPLHIYYNLFKKYHIEKIWYLKNNQIKIKIYKSKNKLIQQLYLVLMIFKGKFSFVGSKIVTTFDENPVLIVKPGITGLSHIKNAELDFTFNKKYQNYYAMHYSIIFDIEILFKSIFKI
tara:strand:- start:1264 stop:2016 length:753 start_codon:yes stop_codon:yes gene_type:complete